MNENLRILIQISLKFVPNAPIDNKASLVQVVAWCLPGDKALSEPMLTQLPDVYICLLLGGAELTYWPLGNSAVILDTQVLIQYREWYLKCLLGKAT